MDGENNGKPYFLMDDLGGNPLFLETSISNMYDFDDVSIVFSFVRQTRLLILAGSDDVNECSYLYANA